MLGIRRRREADPGQAEAVLERARSEGRPEDLRRLLALRHARGVRALEARRKPVRPPVAADPPPAVPGRLPEVAAADLTPELVRAGILRDGCVLVRGLVPATEARALADRIDRAFAARREHHAGTDTASWYEEFEPDPRFTAVTERPWIEEGGGLLAVDSPRLTFELAELLEATGVHALVDGVLGEPGLVSAQKTTLRRAAPDVGGAWHQDGAFMGAVNALNLWLALSRCGDVAPGLDLVARRLDGLVATQTDDAVLSFQVSDRQARLAAGDAPILRPVFEPGDALLFDELLLHQTVADPAMPNPRHALECWFFGASAFPAAFAPLSAR